METDGQPATSATSERGNTFDRFKPLAGPFAVAAVLAVTSKFAFEGGRAGTPSFWVWAVLPSVAFAVLALLRAYRDSELRDWTKFVWGDPTRGIVSAALLVAMSLAFVHAMAPAGSARESWVARLYLQFGDPTALREHALEVAAAIVVAATAEELVWRGLVTRQIAEVVGSRTAWVWAAVLYAATYTPTLFTLSDPVAGKNPVLVLAALALGLFWGGMSRFFGRLVPSILSHAAFDWCVLMMFRLWGPGV
jgi:membrane protease YdiL (CAAX protease family)